VGSTAVKSFLERPEGGPGQRSQANEPRRDLQKIRPVTTNTQIVANFRNRMTGSVILVKRSVNQNIWNLARNSALVDSCQPNNMKAFQLFNFIDGPPTATYAV
jgi:hypothetical protein